MKVATAKMSDTSFAMTVRGVYVKGTGEVGLLFGRSAV
jgi:hypothetical protein